MLLDEVIDAHGGRRRWAKVTEVSAAFRVGGMLMAMRGKRGAFDCGISVATDRQSAIFEPFPRPGNTGVFDDGAVRILDAQGAVLGERERAREAFFGLSGLRRKARWSDLDALYFGGYASWGYLNAPFMFEGDGFAVSEGEPMEVDGERWRRLDVRYPEGLDVHSREQAFWFDDEGMLRRNDYTAEVVGGFARGCHLSWGFETVDGIVFPTRRRVQLRALGGPGSRALPGPPVVTIELDSISLG
jgi:hypothetical protein